MDDLLDMIVSDDSQAQLTDKIKEILYSKAAEKIEQIRPEVSNSFFNGVFANQEEE
jgi:hypothetical protein